MTWEFVACIGAEPAGYAIMPSTVRLGADRTSSRRPLPGATTKSWIDTYRVARRRPDLGLGPSGPCPTPGEGNPPSLIRLPDGRLCLTYGFRAEPFGIRARLSRDDGRTWGRTVVLRDDGGGRDVGYPRERAAAGREGRHRLLLPRPPGGTATSRRRSGIRARPGRDPACPVFGRSLSSPPPAGHGQLRVSTASGEDGVVPSEVPHVRPAQLPPVPGQRLLHVLRPR